MELSLKSFHFPPEIRKHIREELNLTVDNFVVGHVGRFAHQKNHGFLIEVFAQLVKLRSQIPFLFWWGMVRYV